MNNLYRKQEKGIICDICFRHCFLREGAKGFCGVNCNKDGVLTSLAFGNPVAVHVDPIEKKPLFHFFPGSETLSIGTWGCNFRCPFCQNSTLSFGKNRPVLKKYSLDFLMEEIVHANTSIVAFTYNEPTVSWLWYREVAEKVKQSGLKTVMVTNGAMSSEVAVEVGELIDAVNIDLKCGSSTHYKNILQGSREQVLQNISYLHEVGTWIELTTLLVPAISDSEDDLLLSAKEIKQRVGNHIPWHLSAYHPAYDYEEPATDPALVEERVALLQSLGFSFVYPGNILSPADTFCPDCHSVVLKRRGYHVSKEGREGRCPHCHYQLPGRFM